MRQTLDAVGQISINAKFLGENGPNF